MADRRRPRLRQLRLGSLGPDEPDLVLDYKAPTRGLWVWETAIPGDADTTSDLIAFSGEHGITTLFLACDPVGYGQDGAVERYGEFVAAAHATELEVYGMSGYGWFTIPCDAGLDGQPTCFTEGWGVYEAGAGSGLFDGIMDDSESYSVAKSHWSEHTAKRSRWVLHFLDGVRERIGELPLHHTAPAWYDTLEPFPREDGGPEKTLDAWLADTVDVVALMSYRDTAEAVIEISSPELEQGPVWLGVEIADAGEGDSVDFSEEGSAAMMAEVERLEELTADDENVVGVMIHDYNHWKNAAP
ncbi:MAG: hypothetical protein GY884_09260 [Proteobacteria bacterium]|nr:hypothetical protein [Pseudomonadota bacterium]